MFALAVRSPCMPERMPDPGAASLTLTRAIARALALTLLAPVLAPGVRADTADAREEVVVTAQTLETTLPQELAKYGSRLTTITAEQIAGAGTNDVAQTLRLLAPGLYIAAKNGPFDYVDVSLQGSRKTEILWLIDGVRINNRLYASTTPLDTIPAHMVERIEILEGGQGLMYGTQAVAGVVNVVTRPFTDKTVGETGVGADTNGGQHLHASVSDTMAGHRWVLYGSQDKSDGYHAFRDQDYQPSTTDRKRGYDVTTLGAKYAHDFSEAVRLSATYQHTDADLDFAYPNLVAYRVNARDEDLVTVKLDVQASERIALFLKGYFHDWDTLYTRYYNSLSPLGELTGALDVINEKAFWGFNDAGANALLRMALNNGLEYDLGYELQRYQGRDEVYRIDQLTETTHAVFGQIRTTDDLLTNARFAAGLRYSKPSEASGSTIWNVSAQYDLPHAMFVRGNVGTAFRLPSAEELFLSEPGEASGNPDLAPERSRNVNLSIGGAMQAGTGKFSWELIGFAREVTDLISDDGVTFINVNDKVKARGAELALTWAFAKDWSAVASHTRNRTRASGSDDQIIEIPEQLTKLLLSYQPLDRPLGFSASANRVGTVYDSVSGFGRVEHGGYTLVNVGARLFVGDHQQHRVQLNLENVLDKEYANSLGSGALDTDSTQKYVYWNRGVPRTLNASYTYHF